MVRASRKMCHAMKLTFAAMALAVCSDMLAALVVAWQFWCAINKKY